MFNQDIDLYIIEFSASSALARLARLDADPRVLAALAAAYDNDYRNVLAGRNVDDIVCVTKAYDANQYTFRFCNIYPNARAAIKHGYIGLLGRIVTPAQFVAGDLMLDVFDTKRDAVIHHSYITNNISLDERILAACRVGDAEYIDRHYAPCNVPLHAIIYAGAKCAIGQPTAQCDTPAYAKLLIEHGEFDKCRELIPRMRDSYQARCMLMTAECDFASIDDFVADTLSQPQSVAHYIEDFAHMLAKAARIDLLVLTAKHKQYIHVILHTCCEMLDDAQIIDVIEKLGDDCEFVTVCTAALEHDRFAIVDKYWHAHMEYSVLHNIVDLSMPAFEYIIKRFGIGAAVRKGVLQAIAQCEDAAPYEYILDMADDIDIRDSIYNVRMAKYAITRGIKIDNGPFYHLLNSWSSECARYIPQLVPEYTIGLLYVYCASIGDFSQFIKYTTDRAWVAETNNFKLYKLLDLIISMGDIKRLTYMIDLMREYGLACSGLAYCREFVDVCDLIDDSGDVIAASDGFDDSDDEYYL